MPSYKINLINSLVFISCGLIGFISHYVILGGYQQATLIPCILGTLLLVMTPSMRNGNKLINRVVTALTLLFGTIVLVSLLTGSGNGNATARRIVLLAIIAISSFTSLVWYLNNWMLQKRKQ
jgi:hypothetical protein